MEIIKNNPYRIIGILVGTPTREEHTKAKKLKMFIEAGQEVPEDFSFPIIGELIRDIHNVDDAISKLNLNNDRANASLFWFYNGNAITDEPVFNALKASKEETDEAIEVWVKLASADEVTKRNASAFQNLSTFYLNNAFKKSSISKNNFEKGIILKLKFLDSEFINDLIKLSSDLTYKVSKETLQIQFLKQVYAQIKKTDTTFTDFFIDCISKISFKAKQNYLFDFVSNPIEQIKSHIEETKIKRRENPNKGYELGLSLFENEKDNINTIQNILGKKDIQYTSISDKLSYEILQCGIDYFIKYKDTNTDPSSKAMDLFKIAKKLANGSIIIQRCEENTENLQEWIDEKQKRLNYNKINSNNHNLGNWIWGISILIIIGLSFKLCDRNNNNYSPESDTTSIENIDTTATYPYADTVSTTLDSNDINIPSSEYIGNQLKNGTSPLNNCFGSGDYQGNATLTIKNGGSFDAIVCLYSISENKTIRNEYVQKNSSFKMTNIAQGNYKIRIFYGNNWNPNLENSCGTKGNFESDVSFTEFDGSEFFEDSTRGYTNASITLYSVVNGNASSSEIDKSAFFEK